MLIFYQIIMALAAIVGIYLSLKVEQRFLKYIVTLLAVGIIVSFFSMANITVYYLGLLLMLFYALLAKGLSASKKAIIIGITLPAFVHGIFAIMMLLGVFELKLLQVVPLALYLLVVIPKRNLYKAELGILTITAAEAFITVLSLIIQMIEGNG